MSSKLILEETPNTNSAISELESAIQRYTHALTTLEDTSSPSKETVLEVLTARDTVQAELTNQSQIPTGSLIKVNDLDHRLKQETNKITTVDLTEWHAIFNPNVDAWWWFLKPPKHRWDNLDWLWKILTIVFLILSFSLTVDISEHFLSGEAPDTVEVFVAASEGVLTLLVGRTAFTKPGQELIKNALTRLNIPNYFWEEVSCGIAFILLLIFITFRLLLPQIAVLYNHLGDQHIKHNPPEFAAAISDYKRAIALNHDYPEPHYHLGEINEEIQENQKALSQYKIAVKDNYTPAYNNLGRRYIIDEKYDQASFWLKQGLNLINEDHKNDKDNFFKNLCRARLEQKNRDAEAKQKNRDAEAKPNLQDCINDEKREVEYNLLTNLGWARLEQKYYSDAEDKLDHAKNLDNKKAPAYCLLAQVLEKKGEKNTETITNNWESCYKYADCNNIDEYKWFAQAKQHLESTKNQTDLGECISKL
ncbi:tetratricopeptide repeat protein [Moorena sp. SIOASIH]|uniref:tetratricopeptide repeat protein n=1 Tax=Moorena sp. SIOASIH TaxID=2607817 RepID=UPI0025F5F9BE|nr:tetratricopeptide repeat protein [Moorena sp. SIOASIH]